MNEERQREELEEVEGTTDIEIALFSQKLARVAIACTHPSFRKRATPIANNKIINNNNYYINKIK